MSSLNLPEELRAYLEAGQKLVCDESDIEPKGVSMLSLDQLEVRTLKARVSEYSDLIEEDPHAGERGNYLVPAVSLIGTCRNYRPRGLLVWLPDAELFGSFDDDHGTLWVFTGATWPQIAANPGPYLNTCWSPKQVRADQLRLWECYEYEPRRSRR